MKKLLMLILCVMVNGVSAKMEKVGVYDMMRILSSINEAKDLEKINKPIFEKEAMSIKYEEDNIMRLQQELEKKQNILSQSKLQEEVMKIKEKMMDLDKRKAEFEVKVQNSQKKIINKVEKYINDYSKDKYIMVYEKNLPIKFFKYKVEDITGKVILKMDQDYQQK